MPGQPERERAGERICAGEKPVGLWGHTRGADGQGRHRLGREDRARARAGNAVLQQS